jgi:hypothetical protein
MPAGPNLKGTARLVVLAAGIALAGWALWGMDDSLYRMILLVLGGAGIVLGIIGYLPLPRKKDSQAN